MLPNFFVIGAAKSGTTALHHYLVQQPEIFMLPGKDPSFFAYHWDNGEEFIGNGRFEIPVRDIETYEALFEEVEGQTVIGETSTIYLETPGTARRIHERVPDARIAAILRSPVERAYSGYLMRVRAGRESAPVAEALHEDSHYVQVGCYGAELTPYFDQFGSDQVHVCLLEDFKADRLGVYRKLLGFLGVDSSFELDLETPRNLGGRPKSSLLHSIIMNDTMRTKVMPRLPQGVRELGLKVRSANMVQAETLPDDIRARLTDFYRDDVEVLGDLLDRDLSTWLAPDSRS